MKSLIISQHQAICSCWINITVIWVGRKAIPPLLLHTFSESEAFWRNTVIDPEICSCHNTAMETYLYFYCTFNGSVTFHKNIGIRCRKFGMPGNYFLKGAVFSSSLLKITSKLGSIKLSSFSFFINHSQSLIFTVF